MDSRCVDVELHNVSNDISLINVTHNAIGSEFSWHVSEFIGCAPSPSAPALSSRLSKGLFGVY